MVLLELAVQGVRACSASARAALKPGYTLVKGPQAPVPPLAGLVAAILYPDSRGGDQVFLAAGLKTGRAGVSLQGEGGVTFRLVRELGGSGALHKLNPATKAFEVVTQDAGEIVSTLRAQAQLPTRGAFEALYTLTQGQFPSRRPRKAAAAPRELVSGGRELEQLSPEDLAGYEARLPLLQKELVEAKSLAELQFKQDGLQSELYAAESKLKVWDDAKERVKTARADYDSAPTPEKLGLPADIIEQLKRCEVEIKKKDQALRQILDERDGTHVLDTGPSKAAPLWKDNNFTAAMGVGTALTVAGGYLEGPAKYVAMAAILPWSFAAFRALAWVEEAQHATRHSGRYEIHFNREKKLKDERAMAKAQIDAAFTAAQVDTMEQFEQFMGRRAGVHQALGEAEVALAELEVDPEYTSLPEKVAGLRADLEKVQEAFQGSAGGYFRSPGEVEKEIDRVKAILRRARGGPAAAPAAGPETGGGSLEDPSPGVLAAAAELLQADVARAAAEYKDRCGQYLAALSDKRWLSVELTAEGRATLVGPSGRTPVGEAPAKDADLYYLCLRLAVVEKLGQKVKLPLLIEDCFGEAVDAARLPLLNRMLKHLGSVCQVLHVSGSGQNAFQADALVTV